MDRIVSVRTPESISFAFELAGLGSRFLAVMLDLLVQVAVLAALVFGLSYASTRLPHIKLHEGTLAQSIGIAFVVAIVFLIFFGYFILFEAYWDGRTPGKKLLGIRVVRDGGYPLDAGSAAIRNIVRVAEAAAGFYALSAISTLLSPENKRLGDYAAGTIVVRESPSVRPADLAVRPAAAGFSMLTDAERSLIARFVARRKAMTPVHRARMAREIAAMVRPRLSRDLQMLDDDELLTRLMG